MKSDANQDLIKLVNSSGFPFQVAVSETIRNSKGTHKWELDSIEHKWSHPHYNKSGYIDIVCSHTGYIFTLLIECKRTKESNWVFLTPPENNMNQCLLSAFTIYSGSTKEQDPSSKYKQEAFWWDDYCFKPGSFEASFCIVKGQDSKSPMLEHIADDLLPAIESIGMQQIRYNSQKSSWGENRLFLPIITTNARLFRCIHNPSDISLDTGELDASNCKFEEVKWIRFRKSLISHYKSDKQVSLELSKDKVILRDSSNASFRSILVVNANSLNELLSNLQIFEDGYHWNFSEQVKKALSNFHRYNEVNRMNNADRSNQ